MTQVESIRNALVGNFYSRFAVSNGFDFYFESFVLSSWEIVSTDEEIISSSIVDSYSPMQRTTKPELIAKSALIAACLDIPVTAVDLLADSSLLLKFSNNVAIRLPTNTATVDWHWAITESGGDPYIGCHIACFAPGDIQGNMPNDAIKGTSV